MKTKDIQASVSLKFMECECDSVFLFKDYAKSAIGIIRAYIYSCIGCKKEIESREKWPMICYSTEKGVLPDTYHVFQELK